MTQFTIALETPADYFKVEEVIRDAFWGQDTASCDEHYLAHILRKSADFIPELTYVAKIGDAVAGSIMYSKSRIEDESGKSHEVITFGPLATAPKYQNIGIGKALVRHTLQKAKDLGYTAVVIFGEADYYPKLGFQRAGEFGLTTADGRTIDAFMCYPLQSDKLPFKGKFHESSVFDFRREDAAAFDAHFPKKEPKEIVPLEALDLPADTKQKLLANNIRRLNDFHFYSIRELKLLIEDPAEWSVINTALTDQGYPVKFKQT